MDVRKCILGWRYVLICLMKLFQFEYEIFEYKYEIVRRLRTVNIVTVES